MSILVFWVVTTYTLAGGYKSFGGTYLLCLQSRSLQDYMASQKRRPQSTHEMPTSITCRFNALFVFPRVSLDTD
jgi:hypothetical protein